MTRVVVLGGSFAGLTVSHTLLKNNPGVHVTLVNPQDEFYFCIAGPRIFSDPTFFKPEQYLIPIKKAFKQYGGNFDFVQDSVKSIDADDHVVSLSSSNRLSYDYLVIATGSSTNFAALKPQQNTAETIKKLQDAIADASDIVVGGGGPLGIEIAGEIASSYPKKTVTLVSASSRLLDMLKPSAGEIAKKTLANLGVKVILNTKVTGLEDGEVHLEANPLSKIMKKSKVTGYEGNKADDNSVRSVAADLYIPATGVKPNSAAIPEALLTSSGYVRVDENMKVADRIYAAGDVTNISSRLSYIATDQAEVVASNIKSEISGERPSRKFKKTPNIMFVPIGPSTGTGQLFGWVPWSFLVKKLKSKDFRIGDAKSSVYQ